MDSILLVEMTAAWVRRERFKARLIAQEVGRLFAGGSRTAAASGGPYRRVSADSLLREAGVVLA